MARIVVFAGMAQVRHPLRAYKIDHSYEPDCLLRLDPPAAEAPALTAVREIKGMLTERGQGHRHAAEHRDTDIPQTTEIPP